MKTLIVYTSKYGTTEKCVEMVKESINGEVSTLNLAKESARDISSYDTLLIGGPIYFGKGQKSITKFVEKNKSQIKKQKVGLFIACFEGGDKVEKHFNKAFPSWLVERAFIKERLGYQFLQDKLGKVDAFVVKNLIKVKKEVHNIFDKSITNLAAKTNEINA